MGADLLWVAVLQPTDQELDWEAGHARIEQLEQRSDYGVPGNGVKLLLEEGPLETVEQVKRDLHTWLTELEGAPGRSDFVQIEVAGGWLWLTGGMSWGDSPTDLYDAIAEQEPSVLAAVGFLRPDGHPIS